MVAVYEFSWEEVSDPDFGTQPPPAWRDAVAQVAAKAKEKLPECDGRVEKAVALVLAGRVTLNRDGSATVTSQKDPTRRTTSPVAPVPVRTTPGPRTNFVNIGWGQRWPAARRSWSPGRG